MPRDRARPLDYEHRILRQAQSLGLPGAAGRHSLGTLSRGRGTGAGVLIDGTADQEQGDGAGRLLVLSASADSIASGGDFVSFGTVEDQRNWTATDSFTTGVWVHPVSGVYELVYEHEWDSYTGGGKIELLLDGSVPPGGTLAAGTAGTYELGGRCTLLYYAEEGQSGRIRVTHSDGSAQICDATLWVGVTSPVAANPCLATVFSDNFNTGAASAGWSSVTGEIASGDGPDGSDAWDVSYGAGGTTNPKLVYTAPTQYRAQRWVLEFDYYTDAYPSSTADHVLMGTSGSDTQCKTDLTSTGQVMVSLNGLRHTSAAGVVALATWQSWRLDATLDSGGTGSVRLTIDGTVIYTQSGITTAAGPFLNFQLSIAGGSGATLEAFDNAKLTVDTCS